MMNKKEEQTWRTRYSHCDKAKDQDDLIFLYPSEFVKDIDEIAYKLQSIMNFLKIITNLNPAAFFRQRVVIGYRHASDEGGKNCQPGWLPNWINIPWNYLGKNDEPLDMCTHELIHPFFRSSPLHCRNEGWGEGFCDFLRGPAKKVIGLDGVAWWEKMIKSARIDPNSEYHHPAGKFILKFSETYNNCDLNVNNLIGNYIGLKEYIEYLFVNFCNSSLSSYIEPSQKMMNRWQGKNKI